MTQNIKNCTTKLIYIFIHSNLHSFLGNLFLKIPVSSILIFNCTFFKKSQALNLKKPQSTFFLSKLFLLFNIT
jgi:hypothetical protein